LNCLRVLAVLLKYTPKPMPIASSPPNVARNWRTPTIDVRSSKSSELGAERDVRDVKERHAAARQRGEDEQPAEQRPVAVHRW
jgi:hypothetical protein